MNDATSNTGVRRPRPLWCHNCNTENRDAITYVCQRCGFRVVTGSHP